MAGRVEMSAHIQAQIHKIKAKKDRIGDSHSKQLLILFKSVNSVTLNTLLRNRILNSKIIFKRDLKIISSVPSLHSTHCINCPASIKNMIISFRRVTLRRKSCRLNFASCWTSFSSFGSNTRIAALIGFQITVISN